MGRSFKATILSRLLATALVSGMWPQVTQAQVADSTRSDTLGTFPSRFRLEEIRVVAAPRLTVTGGVGAIEMRLDSLASVPVPTLEGLAWVADADPGELVCPLLDARKGEVYAALYAAVDGGVDPILDATLTRVEDLIRRIDRRCRFLGDGVEAHGQRIETALGRRAVLLPFTHYPPRGGTVARLAARRSPRAAQATLGALEPIYIRPAYVHTRTAADTPPGTSSAR